MNGIAVLLLLATFTICFVNSDPNSPNIVLIFADDMGWADLGANVNANETVTNTPTLDRLAHDGIRFTDFHVGGAICTPSRAALLTGRLGLRTGVVRNFGVTSKYGLPTNETTIAEYLKTVDYTTAAIGKWHLGLHNGHHPVDRGFDYYFGIPYSDDMGCVREPTGFNLPMAPPCTGNSSDKPLPLYEDKRIISQPVNLWNLHEYYAEKATSFIRKNANKQKFFLYVPLTHMHVPLTYADKFNVTQSPYRNTLLEMDYVVKMIVQELKDNDIYNNTLLWFMTDNGPWEEKCEFAGDIGPFKGQYEKDTTGGSSAKMTSWEGGHRVPSLIHWPDVVKKGEVCESLTSSLDVLPTLSSLTGFQMKTDRVFDGEDITSLLKNGCSNQSNRTLIIQVTTGGSDKDGLVGCVRFSNYSAVLYTGGTAGCRTPAPPLLYQDPPLIFNLSADPQQQSPLPQNADLIKQVKNVVQDFYNNVKNDKTTIANYAADEESKPCCVDLMHCSCPWS